MSKQNQIQMPGVFGGLMRYDEEYHSRFMITPIQVLIMIVAIILFIFILKIMFPIPVTAAATSVPAFLIPLSLKNKI